MLVLTIPDKLFTGKKPPDEINVMDRLNESKILKSRKFKITKITNVNKTYKINIFDDCFKVSDTLNDKKFVKDFFKLLSKISINKIIENKKYSPPIHWDDDLHIIKLSSKCFTLSKTLNPVDVNPEIDSKYARAHAWRACSLSNLSDWEDDPDPDLFTKAIESANLALELDPNEPEVHRVIGALKLWFERDYDMGKYHFEKARELCPSDVFIICRYATMLIYFSEFEKALGELERAMRLDPFSHDLLFGAEALCHYWLGNYDKAITSYKKVKVLKAHLFYMALSYLKKEDKEMADQKLKEARAMTGMDIESFVKSEPYKDQERINALMVDLESIGD